MTETGKIIPATLLLAGWAVGAVAQQQRPNIVVIMSDQQRADLCGREGFPMEITPFVDRMAEQGAWFNRAYTTAPASVPARTSFLTGRFPNATRVRSNHNTEDAVYGAHLFGVAREQGYQTALVGKNHSFLTKSEADCWIPYGHGGQGGVKPGTPEADFNKYLASLNMYANFEPAPYGVEMQQPYRMVDDAVEWIRENHDQPFLMWLSFSEPHCPYQVCEPYYSMFSPDKIPANLTDSSALAAKGWRYEQLNEMMGTARPHYERRLQELRGLYMGMVRLIDDQVARFIDSLQQMEVYQNTVFVVLADHGDYVGEYGLMNKGAGMPDVLCRIPMVWFGKGIAPSGLRPDHVSIADLFPTFCEVMGAEIPMGVQGRSLWDMLQGKPYPQEEFTSVMGEGGYGGQYYTKEDGTDYIGEGCMRKNSSSFDCLNTWTQSGTQRLLRKGDWKLIYDMEGNGELYNLKNDPMEIRNLYGDPAYAARQAEMVAELLKWTLGTEDPLPIPRARYIFKRYPHNYMFVPGEDTSASK